MIDSSIVSILDKYPKIALAVSGGSDSMAMLEWFRLNRELSSYMVVNIDHHIRGEESQVDSDFVADYCARYGIEYLHYDIHAVEYAREQGMTLEQAARVMRHNIFREVCAERAWVVATAHHLDDQVESILLHIVRGSGIKGLCGMSVEDGYLIRPLLNTPKTEIMQYIREHHIAYREDSTNADKAYSRNYLRHEIIPLIQQKFDSFGASLLKLSRRAGEVQDLIDSLLPTMYVEMSAVKCEISGKHRVLASEILRRAFSLLGIDADIEERHIELLLQLLDQPNGTRLDMPYRTIAYKEDGEIVLELAQDKDMREYAFGEGVYDMGAITMIVSRVDKPSFGDGLYIAGDHLGENVMVRTRRDGDQIQKFGGGSKSLGDYLTDKKVPVRLRDKLPVIADGDNVLAVAGVDISRTAKVQDNTQTIYKIIIEKIKELHMFEKDIDRVLITREEIAKRVKELGAEISKDFAGEELIVVCILRGSCVFYADLIRELDLDVKLDFMVLSSYGNNTATSGSVVVKQDLSENIKGKNVLVVEDIIDSGRTIKRLKEILLEREPKNLKVVTLLDKPERREVEIATDYSGMSIPDEFVIGYGLDYAQRYRNLKDICVLAPKVYQK